MLGKAYLAIAGIYADKEVIDNGIVDGLGAMIIDWQGNNLGYNLCEQFAFDTDVYILQAA